MFFRIRSLYKKMLLVVVGIFAGFNVDAQQRRATRVVPQRGFSTRVTARPEPRQRAMAPIVRTTAPVIPVQTRKQKPLFEEEASQEEEFNKQAVLDEAGSVLKIGVKDADALDAINLFVKQGADYLDDKDILDYQKNVATKGKRIAAAGLLGAYEKNTVWIAEFNHAEKMYSEFAAMLEKESITVEQEEETLDLYNALSRLYEEKRTALQKIRIPQEKITWQALLKKIQQLLSDSETVSFIENIEDRKEKREKLAVQEKQRFEQEQAREARAQQERLEQERMRAENERLQAQEQARLQEEKMRAEAQEEQRVSRKERIGGTASKEEARLIKEELPVITKEEEPVQKELSAKEQVVVRFLGEIHKNFKSYFDEKRKVLKDAFYKPKNSAELNSLALGAQLAIAKIANDRSDTFFVLFNKMHAWLTSLEGTPYEASRKKDAFIQALQAILQNPLIPEQIRGLVSGLLGMFNVQKAVEVKVQLSDEPSDLKPVEGASLEQILTLKSLTLKKGEIDSLPNFFEALSQFADRFNGMIEQTGSIFAIDPRMLGFNDLKRFAPKGMNFSELFEPRMSEVFKLLGQYKAIRDEGQRKKLARQAMNKLFEIHTKAEELKKQTYSRNKDVNAIINQMLFAYQQNILYWLTTIEDEAELVQEGGVSFSQMQKIAYDLALFKQTNPRRGLDTELVKLVFDCLQSLQDVQFDLSLKGNKVFQNFNELSKRVDSDLLRTFIQNTIINAVLNQEFAKINDKTVTNNSGIFLAHEFWIQTIIEAEKLRTTPRLALFAEGIARITRGIVGSIDQYLNTVPSLKTYQSYIAEFEMPEDVALLRNGLEIPALNPYVIQGSDRAKITKMVENIIKLFEDMINQRSASDIQRIYFEDPTSDAYISSYDLKRLNDSIYTFVTDIKSSLSAGINRFNKKMMYAADNFVQKSVSSQPWVVYIQFAFARAYAQCMQDRYIKPYDYPELVKQMLETLYASIDPTVVDTAVKIMDRTVALSNINRITKKETAQVCETILYAKTRYDLLAEKVDHIVDFIQLNTTAKNPKDLLDAVNTMIGTDYGIGSSSEAEPGAQALFVLALLAGAVDSAVTDVGITKQKMIDHLKKGLDIAKKLFFMFNDSAKAKTDFDAAYKNFDALAKAAPSSGHTKYEKETDFAKYKAGMITEVDTGIGKTSNAILELYKEYMQLMGAIDFTHVTAGSFTALPHDYIGAILAAGYTVSGKLYSGVSQDAEIALAILDTELQKTLTAIDASSITDDAQADQIKKDIIDTYKDRLKSKFK